MLLDKKLSNIKGVGEKTREAFEKAGLHTVGDLINFFPRRYEDYSKLTNISDIRPGRVTLKGRVDSVITRQVRRGMHITEATLEDETGKIAAVWFNQPYRATQLRQKDAKWLFSGDFNLQGRKYQLVSASVEQIDKKHVSAGRIVPVYPSVAGLKSHTVRKVLIELQPYITMLDETLPREVIQDQGLLSRSESIMKLHFPTSQEDISKARYRLGFEELLGLLLASKLNKAENNKLQGWHIPFDQQHAQDFSRQLPFKLTDGQKRAVWQIIQDFEQAHPMNRLLQGDVGSGKTVVAGMCASIAAHSGFQTAFMAPTEILASQHAETLYALTNQLGLTVALLTGSVKGKSREKIYQAIKDGEVDIIIGTHALLQDKVVFHKLGFVVIDEQHRFGVNQRQKLLKKSVHMPHLLSMTATPIPRSLALTVYGELDVTVLRERPSGRQAIITKIISPNSREAMYAAVDRELQLGRQVYVVCTLIDGLPDSERKSVETEYKRLRKSIFKQYRIGLLHGQLPSDEKQEIMKQFASHQIDILVSTTVIEVGVDVPNATVMIIENADQFGLAQAHQLRGRVGRGSHQSYCYLVSTDSLRPTRRLRELEKSNDGFYLAEIDLELRGPGEIYGRAQHGQLNLKIAQLSDTPMIAKVQVVADTLMRDVDNLIQYKELYRQVQKYQRITTLN